MLHPTQHREHSNHTGMFLYGMIYEYLPLIVYSPSHGSGGTDSGTASVNPTRKEGGKEKHKKKSKVDNHERKSTHTRKPSSDFEKYMINYLL